MRTGAAARRGVDDDTLSETSGYKLLQPQLSNRLQDRKIKALEATAPDAIVAGNIGCMMQIASATELPVLHTVQLLDWVTGGPMPPALGASNGATAPD